jgi:hypothetical protein
VHLRSGRRPTGRAEGLGIALVAAAVVLRLSALGAPAGRLLGRPVRGRGRRPAPFDRALAEAVPPKPVMIDFFAGVVRGLQN